MLKDPMSLRTRYAAVGSQRRYIDSYLIASPLTNPGQGGEFKYPALQSFCTKRGIMIHLTAAYTPMQNKTVERANRTSGDAVRAMLTGGGMEGKHWAEGACSLVQTGNATPRKCFSGKSAWERYTGQSPLSYFLSQKVLYWQPRVKRDKWETPGVAAHYLSKAAHLLRNSHPS